MSELKNEKIIKHLTHICKEWLYYEEIGIAQNRPVGIKIRDDDAELLTDYVFDVRGTGGKSHGYDHTDGTETKVINLFQPKFCNSGSPVGKNGELTQKKICKSIGAEHKLHYKAIKCDLCGESDFITMEDSRAGIDCKAHFDNGGIIPRYVIWILYQSNDVVTLKGYVIDSKNKFFNEILHEQLTKGSKPSKNFMPYSLDWYFSNPLLFAQYEFTIKENNYVVSPVFFDTENPISEKISLKEESNPLRKDIFRGRQDVKNGILDILGEKNEYIYSEFLENNLISLNWESNLGKIRGITERRKIENLN